MSEPKPDPKVNQFHGLSTLRAKEKATQSKSEQAKALEKYLQKYGENQNAGEEGKKKRKRKKGSTVPAQGLRIIDKDDPGFVKAVKKVGKVEPSLKAFMDQDDEGEEDAPVIANPGEADLYARLAEKEKSGAALQSWEAVDAETVLPSKRQRHDSPNASPPRRQRHDSPDASPPRRQRHDSPDASPPRRQRHDSPDASPPRRQRHDSPDASPPRRQRHDSPDASPPRRQRQNPEDPLQRGKKDGGEVLEHHSQPHTSMPAEGKKKNKVMSDGTVAGMVSGAALAAEMDKKRAAESLRFAKLEAASGSRNAATVYRNAETGARMTKEEYEALEKKTSDKKKPVYEAPAWGGGVRQMRDREQQAADMIKEASKPFARTKADVDEELNLRGRARFGDPMAHLVRQKQGAPPPPVIPDRLAKQMKKSGFVVPQEVPPHSWLNKKMDYSRNRYNIRPGRHWDGVDRSTGFERDMFKMQAERAAREKEARAWGQADM